MDNSGALYVAHTSREHLLVALRTIMASAGWREAHRPPAELSDRIFLADKRVRHFLVLEPCNGWVTIWEDPRYFADRALARALAVQLETTAIWIEVSGNAVAWARGVYTRDQIIEQVYDEQVTTFYGHYGTLHFAFDLETSPEEFIARYLLPYADLQYEAALAGALPASAGTPAHLCFER